MRAAQRCASRFPLWTARGLLLAAFLASAGCGGGGAGGSGGGGSTAPPPLTIVTTAASLPTGAVATGSGIFPPIQLAASGGVPPYTWTLVSGSLPPGLALSSAGVISGKPTAPGTFDFSVQVADASDPVTEALSITINPPITYATAAGTLGPIAEAGAVYPSTAVTAAGGTGALTFSIASGALPPGLSLSASGQIAGTALSGDSPGAYPFSVKVNDGDGDAITAAFSLTLDPALVIVSPALGAAFRGVPYSSAAFQASGGSGSYSFSIASGSTAPLSLNATSGVVSGTPSALGSLQFTVAVKDSAGYTATTPPQSLNISSAPPLSITQQPANQTSNAGSNASFTAAASSQPAPTAQWQLSTDGGATFAPIAGATGNTLNLTAVTAAMNGYEYQAVFSNGVAPNATSVAATLTVDFPPSVATQPASSAVNVGANASFTAAAAGRPQPTVQWLLSTDGGVTFAPFAGATGNTLNLTAVTAAMNGYEYQAVFSNGVAPNAASAAATLTVDVPPAVTTQPASSAVTAGANASFAAAASGRPLPTVQWQLSSNGGATFTAIPGAAANNLNLTAVAAAMNGYEYRAVFSNGVAPNAVSAAATLTVNVPPALSAQPLSIAVNAGANASFTAAASGRPQPTVQWQLSTDGGATFSALPGATGNTLTLTAVAAAMDGYEYRAVFSNGVPPDATSAAASLSVHVPAVVTTEPASQTVVADSNVTFTEA